MGKKLVVRQGGLNFCAWIVAFILGGFMAIGKHNNLENIYILYQQCFIQQRWDIYLFWAN